MAISQPQEIDGSIGIGEARIDAGAPGATTIIGFASHKVAIRPGGIVGTAPAVTDQVLNIQSHNSGLQVTEAGGNAIALGPAFMPHVIAQEERHRVRTDTLRVM